MKNQQVPTKFRKRKPKVILFKFEYINKCMDILFKFEYINKCMDIIRKYPIIGD